VGAEDVGAVASPVACVACDLLTCQESYSDERDGVHGISTHRGC
jgi:hypothetical protein